MEGRKLCTCLFDAPSTSSISCRHLFVSFQSLDIIEGQPAVAVLAMEGGLGKLPLKTQVEWMSDSTKNGGRDRAMPTSYQGGPYCCTTQLTRCLASHTAGGHPITTLVTRSQTPNKGSFLVYCGYVNSHHRPTSGLLQPT
jgi:hypothetical protein